MAAMRMTGVFLWTAASIAFAQTLTVTPDHVLSDEPASVRASGLQSGERVTISAELTDGAGVQWTAQADFVADEAGAVDTAKQAPAGGAYKEVSPLGLVWFMMPAQKNVAAYAAPRNLAAQTIGFELLRKGEKLASAHLQQDAVAEGVRRVVVRDGGLRGVMFVPAGGERSAAVLVVGGSNGGAPTRQAAWLASRGFLALALAYFHYEDLPDQLEAIPLEYFQQGLTWLAARPEAMPGRLAVM